MSKHSKALTHFLHKLSLFPTMLLRMDALCSQSESHKHALLPPPLYSLVLEAFQDFLICIYSSYSFIILSLLSLTFHYGK